MTKSEVIILVRFIYSVFEIFNIDTKDRVDFDIYYIESSKEINSIFEVIKYIVIPPVWVEEKFGYKEELYENEN